MAREVLEVQTTVSGHIKYYFFPQVLAKELMAETDDMCEYAVYIMGEACT